MTEKSVGMVCTKVDDDRNLADGDVEMKKEGSGYVLEVEQMRTASEEKKGWLLGFLLEQRQLEGGTIFWNMEVEVKWEVGKGVGWVFAYILSLTVFSLFTQLPPFQSLDLSYVILAM